MTSARDCASFLQHENGPAAQRSDRRAPLLRDCQHVVGPAVTNSSAHSVVPPANTRQGYEITWTDVSTREGFDIRLEISTAVPNAIELCPADSVSRHPDSLVPIPCVAARDALVSELRRRQARPDGLVDLRVPARLPNRAVALGSFVVGLGETKVAQRRLSVLVVEEGGGDLQIDVEPQPAGRGAAQVVEAEVLDAG